MGYADVDMIGRRGRGRDSISMVRGDERRRVRHCRAMQSVNGLAQLGVTSPRVSVR